MEDLKATVERLAESSAGIPRRNLTEKIKRQAYLEELVKVGGDKPIEALFYYAARSLYMNDSRESTIRAMEMRRLEIAFEAALKAHEADHELIRADAWKSKATEEARTKIYRKRAGKDVTESWEELAMLLAGILDNDPATREDPA